MALKSPYLAAEHSSAERRSRALHRFIVASPVLLLVAVGLVGHLRHRPFASPAGTPDYDRRVLAYRDRVIAVGALSHGDEPPLQPVLNEARLWIAGFDAGTLTVIPPVAYEDHLRDGVRGEAFRAGTNLTAALTMASELRLRSNRPGEAASIALTAARLANRLRGFELQAYLQSVLIQRRSVGVVAQAWPSLPASEKDAMRAPLAALRLDAKEVERLAALEEGQLQDYSRRQQLSPEQVRSATFRFGDQMGSSIRRSIRVNNERIAAILKADETRH